FPSAPGTAVTLAPGGRRVRPYPCWRGPRPPPRRAAARPAAARRPRPPPAPRAGARAGPGASAGAPRGSAGRLDSAAGAALANVGVGYDNLDVAALHARGIVATNTPDVLTETTADLGFALVLAAARRITEGERWLREGQWRQWSFDTLLGQDVHGATLGILGMGRIGQGIARRGAHGFGMRVLYHNRSRLDAGIERNCRAAHVDFDTLLRESDHLVLVLPY